MVGFEHRDAIYSHHMPFEKEKSDSFLTPYSFIIIIIIIIKLKKKSISCYNTLKHKLSFHVQFLAGDFRRGCADKIDLFPISKYKEFKRLKDRLARIQLNHYILSFCTGKDLCNDSGRLAEISNMLILLPASLVLPMFKRIKSVANFNIKSAPNLNSNITNFYFRVQPSFNF